MLSEGPLSAPVWTTNMPLLASQDDQAVLQNQTMIPVRGWLPGRSCERHGQGSGSLHEVCDGWRVLQMPSRCAAQPARVTLSGRQVDSRGWTLVLSCIAAEFFPEQAFLTPRFFGRAFKSPLAEVQGNTQFSMRCSPYARGGASGPLHTPHHTSQQRTLECSSA